MLKEKTRWRLNEWDEERAREIADALNIPRLLAALLVSRGMDTQEKARFFLHTDPDQFHDPFQLDGMETAVERIRSAVQNQEPILIYGDYDVDGVSSTTLMLYTLKKLGAECTYYIPDRFTEGYGLNKQALEQAKQSGHTLVVTVDTGISACEEAEYAKELGLDLIITDHHEPPPELPDALAVINPKKPDCSYPFPLLAGVGVAFKLAHALLGELPMDVVDIAALGTISDLVPLTGENRLIAKYGLEAINRTKHPGLRALIKTSGLEEKELTAEHIGFFLGPRINASGRLDSAAVAVELLTSEAEEEALVIAEKLNELNRERQNLVQKVTAEAERMIETELADEEKNVLVVAGEGWNEGVIGIVASRLVERYYRPALVLSIDAKSGEAKGSARSIEGFHIVEALRACEDALLKFGGHEMAAGMSLNVEEIPRLRRRLNELAGEWLSEDDFVPLTRVDAEIGVEEAELSLIESLRELAPFGVGNPSPVFLLRDVEIARANAVGKDGSHLKVQLTGGNKSLDAIGFGWGGIFRDIAPKARAHVVGELEINEWNGHRKAQLMIKDLGIPHRQIFDWRGATPRVEKAASIAENGRRTTVIYFRKETEKELEALRFAKDVLDVMHVETWKETGAEQVVLYDLPLDFRSLNRVSPALKQAHRIYCLFGDEVNAGGTSTIPDRSAFKRVYAYLFKHKFLRQPEAEKLAKRWRMNSKQIRFILEVFAELSFVGKEEDGYRLSERPEKKELEQSPLYVRQKERAEVETELLYSSYQTLCRWLLHAGETDDYRVREEKVEHGL